MTRSWLALGVSILGVAGWPSAVIGQELRGRILVEDSPGQPVAGALVTLLTASDSTADASFTRGDGSFLLQTTMPGEYRMRLERIGFETWTSRPLLLASSEVHSVEFAVPIDPVRLTGLDVTIRRQCAAPREAALLDAVWDEARKALRTAIVAEDEALLRFNSLTFDRVLSRRDMDITKVTTKAVLATPTTPFESRPADELSRLGYVQQEGETVYFYAPDAKVLLSDTFLADHCFGARRGEANGRRLVGLTFEPVDDREEPDIKGVLWVDEESAELSHVEFVYVRIPLRDVDDDRIGGRIDFKRLPTGAFVVQDWLVRVPVLEPARDRRPDRFEVVGFIEHGGQLRGVFTPRGEPVDWTVGASIRGSVKDPITLEPLRGATLSLDRLGPHVLRHTDPDGLFAFDDLVPGTYRLRISHPSLSLVGINRVERELELEDGRQTVMLELPTAEEIVARMCPDHPTMGAVVGEVRDAETRFPLGTAPVWAEWRVRTDGEPLGTPGSGRVERTSEVRTDRSGRYALCGVPVGEVVEVFSVGTLDATSRMVKMTRPIVVMNFETP